MIAGTDICALIAVFSSKFAIAEQQQALQLVQVSYVLFLMYMYCLCMVYYCFLIYYSCF